MAAANLFKLSALFSLFSTFSSPWTPENNERVAIFPPSCNRIECPSFDVIHVGNGFEIRRYNSSMWMSTAPIDGISYHESTRTGFLQLFDYIQGKNEYKRKIEMTAPVLTQISPSDGPFCASSFVISFYVPKVNQADVPPAKGLHVQKWNTKYAAVRQFGGFISGDAELGQEAAALHASLAGSKWSSIVEKSRMSSESAYTVAGYNSPFEFENRVNEIWMMFEMEE